MLNVVDHLLPVCQPPDSSGVQTVGTDLHPGVYAAVALVHHGSGGGADILQIRLGLEQGLRGPRRQQEWQCRK